MIFIYHCYGGTHSSVLAASYHLKMMDEKKAPTKEEIFSIPLFNKLRYGNIGELFFHGTDEDGNKVYTMGCGREKRMIAAQYNFATMLEKQGVLQERIIFSNTLPMVPFVMKLGGLFSRWLRIDVIGIPLLVIGVKQAYKDILMVVRHTKDTAKKYNDKQIIILDNEKK